MKKTLSNLINFIKKLPSIFNKGNFEDLIDTLAITNFKDNKGSYILFWGIASFTILFVIWSSLASVDQVVRAPGTVVPKSKVHLVQSSITGVVEEINIKMSDNVEKGQQLFLINHINAQKAYDLAKSTKESRERKVELIEDLFNRGAEAEVRLIDERLLLIDAERQYQTALINLKFSKVLSPVKGTISSVEVTNVEQIVQNGQEIASIVPFDDKLQVKAKVMPKDIAYVIQGLKAKIAFTAYDMSIYGTVDGIVTKVAPSTTQENPNDPYYYECIIEINTNDLRKEGKKITLQSGMLADVSILGEDRTVLSYVINPLSKLSKRALRD